jgi:hypothetical protein
LWKTSDNYFANFVAPDCIILLKELLADAESVTVLAIEYLDRDLTPKLFVNGK